jgi:hypothetical protein
MKFWTLTIWTLTLWATIAGYSLFSRDKQDDSLQSWDWNPWISAQVIKQKQKTMWDLLDETTQLADKAKLNAPAERDELLQIIDKNISMKMRIQSTKWYRKFLIWTLPIEEARRNITDALFVENELERNPALLTKLQYTEMWRWYIRGDIPPSNIAYGEIPAIHFIEEFQKNNSTTFGKIESNPIFYKNDNWEETTFTERNNIIVAIMKTEEFLQKNPSVLNKLSQYWYSLNDVYIWQSNNNSIYWQMDAVVILWNQGNFYPEVWQQFLASEKWRLYSVNQIPPQEALAYVNELMWKYAP